MLLQGMETCKTLKLIISLTSIRSEAQIQALARYFVTGFNMAACAEVEGITVSNLQRAIDKVQATSKIVDEILEIKWAEFNQKSDK